MINKNLIKEIKVENDILIVTAEVPLRRFAKEDKKIIDTQKIIELLKDDYKILECLSSTTICNWPRKSCSQKGEWKFKIFVEKKKAPAKTVTQKKESTGSEVGFRGRISKIAKQEQETND